jgi:hypothetical protein
MTGQGTQYPGYFVLLTKVFIISPSMQESGWSQNLSAGGEYFWNVDYLHLKPILSTVIILEFVTGVIRNTDRFQIV